MKILVDMDGIVCDLLAKWLDTYNVHYSDDLTAKRVTSWDFAGCGLKCTRSDMVGLIMTPRFFDDLAPIPGAIAGVRRLQELGHDVKIATTPCGPDSARAKLAWLERHLPGVGYFITTDKSQIDCGMIIDDKPSTMVQFRGQGRLVGTIDYAYNHGVPCDVSGPYGDTTHAWNRITSFVKNRIYSVA